MISVTDALHQIREKIRPIEEIDEVDLKGALGRRLAQQCLSDVAMPPFDRVTMDGYAVVSSDGPGEYDVLETVAAGTLPRMSVVSGKVSKVMTGAAAPRGADAVVMVEKTSTLGDKRVCIEEAAKEWQNIAPKGEDVEVGDVVLGAGVNIRWPEIAILASVGISRLKVYRNPRVSIIATGSELVEPDQVPGEGQIRNSNSSTLMAQCRGEGVEPQYLGIAPDGGESLVAAIKQGSQSDLLLITGGVSMGDYDLVPETLKSCGYEIVFHKVAVKPGKPVLFGVSGKGVVFGMPGNPVSSSVIFELFVKEALRLLKGETGEQRGGEAQLAFAFKRKSGKREELIPVRIEKEAGKWLAHKLEYHGSAHVLGISKGNAFLRIPFGETEVKEGASLDFLWIK